MRRVGKRFLGVETPLFEGMLVAGVIEEECDVDEQVQGVAADTADQGADTAVQGDALHEPSIPSPTPPTLPPQQSQDLPSTSQRIDTSYDTMTEEASNHGRKIDDLDRDEDVALMDDKEAEKKAEEAKEDEPEVQEVVDVVTTAKLITDVVTDASELVDAASTTIADEPQVPAATITVVLVEMDEEFVRKLHKELNKDIDWELHQIDTFYNALTQSDDSLNAVVDGNLLNRTPLYALTIIENKSKVRISRYKLIVSKVSTTTTSQSPSSDVSALTDIVKELVLMNKATQQATVKSIEETCVVCGGPHPYYECLAAGGNTFDACVAVGTYNQ
nr:reverse transcriptase domain-containing protein [Tanacetum cinerariifolium]